MQGERIAVGEALVQTDSIVYKQESSGAKK